jgi:hypothetical protein
VLWKLVLVHANLFVSSLYISCLKRRLYWKREEGGEVRKRNKFVSFFLFAKKFKFLAYLSNEECVYYNTE